MFKISEVRVNRINKGKFLGYASVLLDKCFIIDGIELYDGNKGRYILMPINYKIKTAKRNSAYPNSEEARLALLEAISKKYDEEQAEE